MAQLKDLFKRKKHLFISSESTGLDVIDVDGNLHRLEFHNCVCTFDDDKIAEAIRAHPHFGWRFFEDKKDRQIENPVTPEKKTLSDALGGMSIQMLRTICKEQKLMDGDWKKITATPKKDLVLHMTKHKEQLGHYATLGS